MELFSARVCPYAHRTRLLLIEKNVPFVLTEIDFRNKPTRFMQASPYGKVPVVVHDGSTIYESAIINEYVDEVFASPSFMPSSPLLRAKSRIWIDYCDDYFIDDHYALLKNQETARHPMLLEKARRNFIFIEEKGLAELGGSGPYWLGAEVSLVDFAWYPFFERLPAWSYYRGLQIPESCHRLKAWIAAMAARSSVRQIMNDRAYYIEHYLGYAKQVLSA